jgi:hypothetical protein
MNYVQLYRLQKLPSSSKQERNFTYISALRRTCASFRTADLYIKSPSKLYEFWRGFKTLMKADNEIKLLTFPFTFDI